MLVWTVEDVIVVCVLGAAVIIYGGYALITGVSRFVASLQKRFKRG